mgnify:CR=1 FL=1
MEAEGGTHRPHACLVHSGFHTRSAVGAVGGTQMRLSLQESHRFLMDNGVTNIYFWQLRNRPLLKHLEDMGRKLVYTYHKEMCKDGECSNKRAAREFFPYPPRVKRRKMTIPNIAKEGIEEEEVRQDGLDTGGADDAEFEEGRDGGGVEEGEGSDDDAGSGEVEDEDEDEDDEDIEMENGGLEGGESGDDSEEVDDTVEVKKTEKKKKKKRSEIEDDFFSQRDLEKFLMEAEMEEEDNRGGLVQDVGREEGEDGGSGEEEIEDEEGFFRGKNERDSEDDDDDDMEGLAGFTEDLLDVKRKRMKAKKRKEEAEMEEEGEEDLDEGGELRYNDFFSEGEEEDDVELSGEEGESGGEAGERRDLLAGDEDEDEDEEGEVSNWLRQQRKLKKLTEEVCICSHVP